MRRRYEESDNAVVNTARVLADRLRDIFGPVFEETEHAHALAELREVDPSFTIEDFMKEAREFMIPEILEAYIDWDEETLKQWCSDGVFNILQMSRYLDLEEGSTIEGQLLDLRNVDVSTELY
jgi:import inner membrane translocase subunit TIM44